MISTRPIYHYLQATFEAKSAHAIHTGFGDTTHDSLVVRDANGLPTLVGTSLAGVLRHAYAQHVGEAQAKSLFGYAEGDTGQSSWISVGFGLIHDSHNEPYQGIIAEDMIQNDILLSQLIEDKPLVRQRVKLNDKGVTDKSGKFDMSLVPKGVRYTTLIGYWGEVENDPDWQDFVQLLLNQPLRIGSGTRNGYGMFEVVSLYSATWNLKNKNGQQAYQNRPRQRGVYTGLTQQKLSTQKSVIQAILNLQAESYWRVGGGELFLGKKEGEREPDMLPMHEKTVTWYNDKATLSQQLYLLPASAIKGAVRHRVAFHYNCLTGQFGNACSDTDENKAVIVLFGSAGQGIQGNETEEATDNETSHLMAGILAFNEVYLEQSMQHEQTVMHNKIDQFTVGVIKGALFSEHNLYQNRITITLEVIDKQRQIDAKIKQALDLALEDLANGWLPLGASGSRGLGTFIKTNDTTWSDNKTWLNS